MEIIHQSSKLFWKHKCTLDVRIIEHYSYDVCELTAYDPASKKESESIFIDRSVLVSMLNEEDIESNLKALKEPFLRRKETPPDESVLELRARNQAKSELILNRLQIEKYSLEGRELCLKVSPTVLDMEKGRPSLCCAKPPGLVPYTTERAHQHTASEVMEHVDVLEKDVKSIQKDTSAAKKYQETARSALSVRERWRVALVFGKVSRGRRLSAGDAKIWDIVSKNLPQDGLEGEDLSESNGRRRKRPNSRPHSPLRSRQASRQLSPREAVSNIIASPRSYSVLPKPLSRQNSGVRTPRAPTAAAPSPGVGTEGLAHSLEQSLALVPGHSLDTTNKHYRVAASCDLDEVEAPHGLEGSLTPRSRGTLRINTSGGAHSPRSSAVLQSEHSGGAHSPRRSSGQISPTNSSRPLSAAQQSARAKRQSSPMNRVPSKDETADTTPKSRRRTKEVVPPTPCEIANQQLLAARMLRSLAAMGNAVATTIRSSFTGGSMKVHADAAAAAVATTTNTTTTNTTTTTTTTTTTSHASAAVISRELDATPAVLTEKAKPIAPTAPTCRTPTSITAERTPVVDVPTAGAKSPGGDAGSSRRSEGVGGVVRNFLKRVTFQSN